MATVVAVCVALAQGGGRLLVGYLSEVEGRINGRLAGVNARVQGLSGTWRHLNPSIEADSFTFAGGELVGVSFELDLLESLLRNRIVARRFKVASGRLRLVETESGWRLGGAEGAVDFDFGAFLRHSDELSFAGRVELESGDARGVIYARASAVNRGGRHRLDASVSTEPGCHDCELRFEAELNDAILGVREPVGFARVSGKGFHIGEVLASLFSLPSFVLEVDARWANDGGAEQLAASISMTAIALPGGVMELAADAAAVGGGDAYRGVVGLRAGTLDANVVLDGIDFNADFNSDIGGSLMLWMSRLDLGEVNELLASVLGADDVVGQWFVGLGVAGQIHGVRLHLDAAGLAYEAQLANISMSAYRGIPEIANARGVMRGHQNGLRLELGGENWHLGFPEQFENTWDYDTAAGRVTIWFERGYVGLRGTDLSLDFGATRAAGGFALTRPRDPMEGRLVIIGDVDGIAVADGKRYIPRKLQGNLKPWLESSLLDGRLNDGAFVYHGHNRTRPGVPMRRIEIKGRMIGATVDYHRDWPPAEALYGRFEVTGRETRVWVSRGAAFDAEIHSVEVVVPASAAYADIKLSTRVPTQRALDFVLATPVATFMPYVSEQWRGGGEIAVDADLRVPLTGELKEDDLKLGFDLVDTSLDLSDLGLHFEGLRGSARFRSPYHLAADSLHGSLFGFPVSVDVSSSEQSVAFEIRGRATVTDVYDVLDIRDLDLAAGAFGFDARFELFPQTLRPPELVVASDAVGVTVDLPAPLFKAAQVPRQMEARVVFADDYVIAEMIDDVMTGWIHVGSDEVLRGAIGIGVAPAKPDLSASRVVLTGGMDALRITSDVVGDETAPIAWQLDDFVVQRLELENFELKNVTLNGFIDGGETAFDVKSDEVTGSIYTNGAEPWQVKLAQVRVPPTQTNTDADPMDVALIDQLPEADVTLEQVLVGTQDYGSWKFGIRPVAGALHFTDVVADVKGLHIESSEDVVWTKGANRSRFSGRVTAGDLAEVLPRWEYTPNVESKAADIQGEVDWAGSPLMFELKELSGEVAFTVTEGRFLDVEDGAGAARILALLKLNFSGLFRKGIAFDHIAATTKLDKGRLEFVQPMQIEGPGSVFKINGAVDFADGTLDNEMIVTLPLSSSLPWYAIWLAPINPASALGVLLGQQVFKEQIEQFSSAKYKISGTIEEPELEFVSIFTKDIQAPEPGEVMPE